MDGRLEAPFAATRVWGLLVEPPTARPLVVVVFHGRPSAELPPKAPLNEGSPASFALRRNGKSSAPLLLGAGKLDCVAEDVAPVRVLFPHTVLRPVFLNVLWLFHGEGFSHSPLLKFGPTRDRDADGLSSMRLSGRLKWERMAYMDCQSDRFSE